MSQNRRDCRVALVVPCYNEAQRLNASSFLAWIGESSRRLILVDDRSTDGTLDVLHTNQAAAPERVQIVARPANMGKAEAVRAGMQLAMQGDAEFAGYWDADLATPLAEVDRFLEVALDQPACDIVLGARVQLLGRRIERLAVRHYLGRVFATCASVALRLPVYDTQCGAKLFRVNERTIPLFASPFISRWVFDVEILARYMELVGQFDPAGPVVIEHPLQTWQDVAGSKVRPRHFLIAARDLYRIARRHRRVAPPPGSGDGASKT
jgi:glycosyltransferase involved in cell wall biosynthesis